LGVAGRGGGLGGVLRLGVVVARHGGVDDGVDGVLGGLAADAFALFGEAVAILAVGAELREGLVEGAACGVGVALK
jgi:hypothetical protein